MRWCAMVGGTRGAESSVGAREGWREINGGVYDISSLGLGLCTEPSVSWRAGEAVP